MTIGRIIASTTRDLAAGALLWAGLSTGHVAAQSIPLVIDAQASCSKPVVVPAPVLDYIRAGLDPSLPRVSRPTAVFQAYNAAVDDARRTDWAQLCHYRADDMRLAAMPTAAPRIVYLGDSITELWGIADPAFFAGGRINRGISGQTSGQMLLRFQADVVALRPAVVHIMAGVNDLAGINGPETEQDIRNNIVAMTTLARAAGIRVVLASVTPAGVLLGQPGVNPSARIVALNGWIEGFARQSHIAYVDYHRLLATPEGALPPTLTFDGLHLNLPGYRRIEGASLAATRPSTGLPNPTGRQP